MTQDVPAGVWISLAVTGLLMLAWIVWGVREYRRTGRATWLWMAVVLGVGLVVSVGRWVSLS